MKRPLVIDGYCGLGGWSEGFMAEGFECIGIDIERHDYGTGGYPGHLILQNMKTVNGAMFKHADCLVFSPPCQEYSYMAMPWSRAKQIAAALRGQGDFPEGYKGSRTIEELNALFNACFRIQREASEAAGRHIPMVIENVRGAQPWVGKARANYGSFYLWGDVPALMPMPHKARKVPGFRFDGAGGSFQTAAVEGTKAAGVGAGWKHPSDPRHVPGLAFNTLAERATKTIAHVNRRDGHGHTRHPTNQAEHDAVKFSQSGAAWFDGTPRDKMLGQPGPAAYSSKSSARKAASARIAKIPFRLAKFIAAFYKPEGSK